MRRSSTGAQIAVPLLLALPAGAQTITTLVIEGDPGPGGSSVIEIQNIAIDSAGTWLVEVQTDDPDPALDEALYRNGVLYLQQGDALPMPAGATLSAFDAMTLDADSSAAFDFTLGNTAGGGTDNGGIYFNTALVLQKGSVSTAAGFGPGTVYGTFSDCKLNDAGQIMLVGLVDDPNVAGTSDWACVVLDTDGAGNLLGETRVAGEGDTLPGQTLVVNTIRSGPHASAFNHQGDVIFGADLDTGSTGDDAVVYMNATLLAQEGSPSGVPGRNWGDLVSPEVDLNANGDWTIKDTLDGASSTDGVIVKNGAKFVQEGDSLPDIAPFVLTYLGNGPAALTEAGDVLWFGRWDDPDTSQDEGLFLNQTLLVQQGVTMIGGQVVIDVGDQSENYAISDDGRYIVFEATLDGGLEGAFQILIAPEPTAYCFGDGSGLACPCGNTGGAGEGCANSSGAGGLLAASGSTSAGADDLAFAASQLLPGQPALLFVGVNAVNGGAGQPFGDGLRCAGMNVVRLGVDTPDANGDAAWGPGLGAQGGWSAGDTRYFQGWYRDPAGSPCGSTFNLTPGVEVEFQP